MMAWRVLLALTVALAAAACGNAGNTKEELPHARHLQQFLPPLPIVVPLPPFLTGNDGFGSFGGSGSQGSHRGSTSLQANSSANGNCTATWAGVLASQPDLFFLSSALSLTGFGDQLPSPNLPVTVFAPTNNAILGLLNYLNLGLLDLLQFQSKLPGLLLYAVALGGYSGDALLQRGSISTLLSQAENKPYNLNFTLDPVNNHRLLVTGVDPNIRAVTQRALKVCNSYLYVLDAVLLPAQNNRLSAIPEVNATFLQALANLGNPSSSSSSSTSGSVGNITDPSCQTTFLQQAQQTPGLDFLVQAILRGNLLLPAAGSGATSFAPNNAAFTDMLQTLNLTIVDALNLGDKLQSILYYHFLPQAYNASQLAALGSSNTDLGVSTGTPYNVTFGRSATGQVQVTGQYPNNTANILNATTICNSQVYIVDKVLLPANATQFIPSPGNGLVIANSSASSNASAALFPGLSIGSNATRAHGRCQQAFLDAATQHNLTFLVQGTEAGNLVNGLPNFARPTTVLAPINSAFYNILTGTDFGLAQLAQSGSRLKSVLLYHMMPGGAFSLDQLANAGNVTTLLGQDLNTSYPLQFGKNSTGDVVVSGLHTNNTANILGSFPVCNSTVYITDLVLLPADSLQGIPQAPAVQSPTRAGRSRAAAAPMVAPAVAPAAAPKTGPVAAQSVSAASAPAAAAQTGPASAQGTGQAATGFTAVGTRNFGRR
ncbi:g11533 [Coccomyxa viridis]|uniref:G11533 protein n=1 Tax=Coccomyxa viridis TaxID=1274662 RepID=A0ABP1GAV8_9CHLO